MSRFKNRDCIFKSISLKHWTVAENFSFGALVQTEKSIWILSQKTQLFDRLYHNDFRLRWSFVCKITVRKFPCWCWAAMPSIFSLSFAGFKKRSLKQGENYLHDYSLLYSRILSKIFFHSEEKTTAFLNTRMTSLFKITVLQFALNGLNTEPVTKITQFFVVFISLNPKVLFKWPLIIGLFAFFEGLMMRLVF